jgi:hypothetical protein
MSLITPLLKQTATHKPFVSVNSWGTKTYGTTATIKCRYEKLSKLFRGVDLETWTSEAHVFADVELKEGDLISYGGVEKEIQKISHMPDLDGSNTFWEGWL